VTPEKSNIVSAGIDWLGAAVAIVFAGLGGVVRYLSDNQARGESFSPPMALSQFFIGAYAGALATFYLLTREVEYTVLLCVAGGVGYGSASALQAISRVVVRHLGGSLGKRIGPAEDVEDEQPETPANDKGGKRRAKKRK
jgi:hypothetical protein